MDMRPDQTERSRFASDSMIATEALRRDSVMQPPADGARPALALVSGSRLALAQPEQGPPDDWQTAMADLAQWLEVDVQQVDRRPARGLRQVAAWAAPAAAGSGAPVFAPWQRWSPVALQNGGEGTLPRAGWVASYLLDQGAGKAAQNGALDVVLMSPLPASCLSEDGCGSSLPHVREIKAMIRAAKAEGRSKLAIVVPARSRNAMIRQLLLVDRSLTRDGLELEIVSIEEALCQLMRSARTWDAIVVTPDLRSIVFATLAEVSGITGPWPMLWYQREHDLCLVSGEVLADDGGTAELDGPLLAQAFALAAHNAGLTRAALRLHESMARIWARGVVTPGRSSIAPYVTEIGDGEFIAQICKGAGALGNGRQVPAWAALATEQPAQPARSAPGLRIVASN